MIGTTIFAGTNGGIYRSTNGGQTWTSANVGLTNTLDWSFAVSGTTLFTGSFGGGVFRSNRSRANLDAGQYRLNELGRSKPCYQWAESVCGGRTEEACFARPTRDRAGLRSIRALSNLDVEGLAVSGTNLFAGTFGGGAFPFERSGAELDTGQYRPHGGCGVFPFAVSGTTLFAGSGGGGIYRTTNDGATWTQVNTGFTHSTVRSFVVSGSSIYAGSSGSRSLSLDRQWPELDEDQYEPEGDRGEYPHCEAARPSLLAPTVAAFSALFNQGQSWEEINTGLGSLESLLIRA